MFLFKHEKIGPIVYDEEESLEHCVQRKSRWICESREIMLQLNGRLVLRPLCWRIVDFHRVVLKFSTGSVYRK